MSSYYDHEFIPWQIIGGQCVVADEAEWKRINQINRSVYSGYLDWVDSGGRTTTTHHSQGTNGHLS